MHPTQHSLKGKDGDIPFANDKDVRLLSLLNIENLRHSNLGDLLRLLGSKRLPDLGQHRRLAQQLAADPVPHKQVVIATAADQHVPALLGDAHPAHELVVAQKEALDHVRLRDTAAHADVLVPVGRNDVRPARVGRVHDHGHRSEHGHVAQLQRVLELRGLQGRGELGRFLPLQAALLVLQRLEVAERVHRELVSLRLDRERLHLGDVGCRRRSRNGGSGRGGGDGFGGGDLGNGGGGSNSSSGGSRGLGRGEEKRERKDVAELVGREDGLVVGSKGESARTLGHRSLA